MYHLNQAVRTEGYDHAHVASGDTDILICLMYHHLKRQKFSLQELWMHHNGLATPLHECVERLPEDVVRTLPAVHALSGCDTTSKVGTKLQAFNGANKEEHAILADFEVKALDNDMFESAERFLVDCMSRSTNRSFDTFDDLR